MTGSTASSAVGALSADFFVPRAGRVLVEDFLGATAFLEGATDLGPFVAADIVYLVDFGAGAAGAWVAT
jgi:hypothetical protein